MDVPPEISCDCNDETQQLLQFLSLYTPTETSQVIQNNNIVIQNNNNIPLNNKTDERQEDENLTWIALLSLKQNPDACWCCPKCNKVEDVVKAMLQLRKWTLIRIDTQKGGKKHIFYKCNKNHEGSITYEGLRKGCNCVECNNDKKRASGKPKLDKIIRPNCECRGTKPGTKPHVCPHWNHKVTYPDSAKEWDIEKNKPVLPEHIAPHSNDTYGFICSKCGEPYDQIVDNRSARIQARCPYCTGLKVSPQNCLATTHPEIAVEWSPKNGSFKPTDITHGCHLLAIWMCKDEKHKNEEDGIFHYPMVISKRTSSNRSCPSCNDPKYEQVHGGHEHFVKVANEKHGGKFGYPDGYKGHKTKVNIDCGKIGKDGFRHGLFRQTPSDHKQGKGCPKCANEFRMSKKVEEVNGILKDLGYIEGVNLIKEWSDEGKIKNERSLYSDDFLPNERLVFEVDGSQHFDENSYYHTLEDFITMMNRDMIKDKYFLENRINLLRIPYNLPNTREWIEQSISLCKQGYHIYFSYKHYYDELIKTTVIDSTKTIVLFMECPPLKFKKIKDTSK